MASSSTDYQRIVAEGLRALQQKQYDQAIALLKPVMGDRRGPGNARLKAALGVFQAYGESGQTAAAQELGQQLKAHKNPQVRDRAEAIWNRLQDTASKLDPAASTLAKSDTSSNGADSGFMPLDGGMGVPGPNPDFQPISAAPQPRKVVRARVQPTAPPAAPPAPPAANGSKLKSPGLGNAEIGSFRSFSPPATKPPATKPEQAESGETRAENSAAIAPPSPPPPPPNAAPRQRIVIDANAANPLKSSAASASVSEDKPGNIADGPQPYEPQWRNAGKIDRWGTLPGAPGLEYQGLQLLSVIAFGAIATLPFVLLVLPYNYLLLKATWFPSDDLELIRLEPSSFVGVWVVFAALLVATPWLLDEGLKRLFKGRSLRLLDLNAQCPETGRLLQRQCRRNKIAIPRLLLLPTMDPLLFS
ncbi:MAG: hypothetical protein AAF889_00370 [Cyanobacteria bacterium P01_D01_bin.73]